MFRCDLSTLDGRDIADTIEALEFLLSNMPGQSDNICFQSLLAIMSDEWHRSAGAHVVPQDEIVLSIGDATPAHVWALLKFAGSVVQAAAKGEPSEMGPFFGCVINQIEQTTQQITAAALN